MYIIDNSMAVTRSKPSFLDGGGQMGDLIYQFDWAVTSIGPLSDWPQSLKTAVDIMLNSNHPMWIGWGREMVFLYNDAYVQVLGLSKHPWALGRKAEEVWKEIWDVCEPLADKVFNKSQASFVDEVALFMDRGDFVEETFYSFSYSPIRNESGRVGGLFCPSSEITAKILNTRRLATLSELAATSLIEKTIEDACATAARTLAKNPSDIPFALLYRIKASDQQAMLVQAVHVIPEDPNIWPLEEVLQGGEARIIPIGNPSELPKGAAGHPLREAILVPVTGPGHQQPVAILVAGLSPNRKADAEYRTFFTLAAQQIGTAIQNAQALQEEREKAEALAALDRSKTVFFNNISHEFRTPLTLMLGPLEDLLADPGLDGWVRNTIDLSHRNALRMLKLVNHLLDFSRIEAGRMQAHFELTALDALTTDIASGFRSAIEKAGIRYVVDCVPLKRGVQVDRDLWEKIVLNLISNAYKYTLSGEITVGLKEEEGRILLTIRDTGVGIPEAELPKIFDRFHRVEHSMGRTFEGSGIGLALVKELVGLHEGVITAESKLGEGSVFRVSIPYRHSSDRHVSDRDNSYRNDSDRHVSGERVKVMDAEDRKESSNSKTFMSEVNWWTPAIPEVSGGDEPGAVRRKKRILLADDNSDMRVYIRKLLSEEYEIVAVTDGEAAWERAQQEKFDLVLADIMMPWLNGFGLLKKIRGHKTTMRWPVIFLSGRAGEEAMLEGLEAGADDYLVKPFSGKELQARVTNHITINAIRKETEEQFYNLFLSGPVIINVFKGPDFIFEFSHPLNRNFVRGIDPTGLSLWEVLPELKGQGLFSLLGQVYRTGEKITRTDELVFFLNEAGEMVEHYFDFVFQPWYDAKGRIQGVMNIAMEVTERMKRRLQIEESQRSLVELANAMPQLVWVADPEGVITYYNNRLQEFSGMEERGAATWAWEDMVHPEDQPATRGLWEKAQARGSIYEQEHRLQLADGSYHWFLSRAIPQCNEEGRVEKWFGTATDIDAIKKLQQQKDDFLKIASHELRTPITSIRASIQFLVTQFREEEELTRLPSSGSMWTALEIVDKQIRKLTRLLSELLDISKIDSGKLLLNPVVFDMAELVEEVRQEIVPIHSNHSINVRNDAGATLLKGDRDKMTQVLTNLLNNAIKYSPDAPEIGVELLNPAPGKIRICIRDRGIGIDPDDQERIFERFYRVPGAEERLYPGFGIGLYLAREIVEQHKGEIAVESEKGRGSVFSVTLPLSVVD